MKKSITLLFAIFFFVPLFAQSFWERASGPNGLNIETLKYSAQGVFYATDYNDRTFRSVDSGLTWEEIKGPVTGLEIRRLEVGYNGTLFCVGTDWITIYRSTDLGDTWETVTSPFYTSGYTEAADGGFLIAVEGSILRTYDDVIWDTLYLNPNPWSWNAEIRELGWLPDGTLVASPSDCYDSFSGDYFLISQDTGGTWDTLPGAGPIANLAALGNGEYIFSANHSCYMVYKTSIGGASPTLLSPDIISPEEDFVVTSSGNIIVSDYYKSRISDDGGNTWQTYEGNVFFSFSTRVLPGNLLLRGWSFGGNITRSTDLGKTWKFSGYGVADTWVFDLTFKNQDKAFGLSSSGLWRSLDAGEHWQIVPQDTVTTSPEFDVYNLALAPNGDLYMLRPYLLQRSTDDGETFQNISPDSSLGKFARVAVHPQTGDLYLTGDSVLAKSSDQGQSWQVLNTTVRFNYRPIVFHPDGTLYGIGHKPNGSGNTLLRSDDGGVTWQYIPLNPPYNPADNVQIAPDGKIVAAYGSGFYNSTNNGTTWTIRSAPINSSWVLKLNAAGHAYIGDGNDKRIFKTENDGISWSALPAIPSTLYDGIVDFAFDQEQHLWVCTNGDGHFKTIETTVNTSQPQSRYYALEIFPNPAEGGFWINWDSEKSEMPATLILRDLCGREISHQSINSAPAYVSVPDPVPGLYMLELNKDGQRIGLGKVFLK